MHLVKEKIAAGWQLERRRRRYETERFIKSASRFAGCAPGQPAAVPASMVETELHECAAEPVPSHVLLDCHPAQAPGRVGRRSEQGLAADGRHGEGSLALVDGEMQRRRFVVAAKAARLRLIVQKNRPPQR